MGDNSSYKIRRAVPLTPEERRVAALFIDGYPISAIAEVVGAGSSVVRRRLTSVFQKYGTKQLVAVGLKLSGVLPEFED